MNIKFLFFLIVYQLIQIIVLPLLPIYLLIRKIKKKPVFGSLKERIGFVPKVKSEKKVIWIHAVSVGEILSIENLIDKIKKNDSNALCYVTTGTIAGKKIAQKMLKADYISFLPYDFLIPMFIAFKRIKPRYLIIVEAETWPNLIAISNILKVETFAINARISRHSKNKYLKLRFIFKEIFNSFKLILTQTEEDKLNFVRLGVKKNKILILGNIKALNVLKKKDSELTKDKQIKQYLQNQEKNNQYKVLLAGSIHSEELDLYLNMFKKLKKEIPNLKLIIAPRHFHWKKELIKKVQKKNLGYFLWDKSSEKQINKNLTKFIYKIFESNDILLVCKLGEMFKLYKYCDIFFLGGTFVPIGGHNLLEPAVWQKPSIIGPYYQNTKNIALELKKENGIIIIKNDLRQPNVDIVNNTKKLYFKTKEILRKKELAKQMGINSLNWLKNESTKVEKNLNKLIRFIK